MHLIKAILLLAFLSPLPATTLPAESWKPTECGASSPVRSRLRRPAARPSGAPA